jgi:hypothetical protein
MPSVMGKQWVSNATWQKKMKNEDKNKKREKYIVVLSINCKI